MRASLALLVLSACAVPASQPATPAAPREPEIQPEWNVRAEENLRAGPAYYERVKAAPRRAPTEEITVVLQSDAMDFFRKSIAHDNISRDMKLAVDEAVNAKQHPTVRVEDGGAPHEQATDWYDSATKTQRRVDVLVRLTFRTVMRDEALRMCPDMKRPLVIIMKAAWSSAYLRNDHVTEEHTYCRAGYPDDLGESVPQMRAVVDFILADIDTNLRNELPALSEATALSPPYRASWQWRRPPPDSRWFGIF